MRHNVIPRIIFALQIASTLQKRLLKVAETHFILQPPIVRTEVYWLQIKNFLLQPRLPAYRRVRHGPPTTAITLSQSGWIRSFNGTKNKAQSWMWTAKRKSAPTCCATNVATTTSSAIAQNIKTDDLFAKSSVTPTDAMLHLVGHCYFAANALNATPHTAGAGVALPNSRTVTVALHTCTTRPHMVGCDVWQFVSPTLATLSSFQLRCLYACYAAKRVLPLTWRLFLFLLFCWLFVLQCVLFEVSPFRVVVLNFIHPYSGLLPPPSQQFSMKRRVATQHRVGAFGVLAVLKLGVASVCASDCQSISQFICLFYLLAIVGFVAFFEWRRGASKSQDHSSVAVSRLWWVDTAL